MAALYDPYLFYIIFGGRAGTKSWGLGLKTLDFTVRNPDRVVMCVREIQRNIDQSMKRLLERLIKGLNREHQFEIQRDRILCVNGTEINFRGLSDSFGTAERIKSFEAASLTVIDEGQEISNESLNILLPTVMRQPDSHIMIGLNPREPDGAVYERFILNEYPNSKVIQVNYDSNPYFSEAEEAIRKWDEENQPELYEHIWMGAPRPNVEGALWTQKMISDSRMTWKDYEEGPDADDIVVGIDPAGTRGEKSDNTGISVISRIGDEGFILHSTGKQFGAEEWARKALELREEYNANRIVVEVSGAGVDSMVRNITSIDDNVYVKPISPSGKGSKFERAVPFATMTKLGKFHISRRAS